MSDESCPVCGRSTVTHAACGVCGAGLCGSFDCTAIHWDEKHGPMSDEKPPSRSEMRRHAAVRGEAMPDFSDKGCRRCWQEHAEMLALLRDRDDWRRSWACGNPAASTCEGGADGPCWEHRRRALLDRIDKP